MTDPKFNTREELEVCPATFGRETAEHSWVTVSQSSYRPTPYTMCSKCGQVATIRRVVSAHQHLED